MKNYKRNDKDERAIFIENVSYKFGYNLITFVLLFDVIYRGLIYKEAAWDLLGIIIISGLVMTLYQYKQKILDKSWIKNIAISTLVTFIVTLLVVFILKGF